jgi:hypothetical protein
MKPLLANCVVKLRSQIFLNCEATINRAEVA